MFFLQPRHALLPSEPALHDTQITQVAPYLRHLQARPFGEIFILGSRTLLGIDERVHLQIQPAGRSVTPIRQQGLRRLLSPRRWTLFTASPVRGADHMLADQQLALRCHGRRTALQDLHCLLLRPVVNDVAHEVDLRPLHGWLLEEVHGHEPDGSALREVCKVVLHVLV